MKILVTGAAGFIGFHLASRLLGRGDEVCGVDNLNDYYDVALKQGRLNLLKQYKNFQFIPMELADASAVQNLFQQHSFDRVVHLAAQAGVRFSVTNPQTYIQSNLVGFANILEGCRHAKPSIQQLIYASSSSVYGLNAKTPFHVEDNTDHPISLYGATKKANELMAHAYSHLYHLPVTGLRFFTVYGPWGRPDMAYYKFTRAIFNGEPIEVYQEGRLRRDFTYIEDVISSVVGIVDGDPGNALCRLYNIGHHHPIEVNTLIECLEKAIGKKAILRFLPMQPGDMRETHADVSELKRDFGFVPTTSIEEGLGKFVAWYQKYC